MKPFHQQSWDARYATMGDESEAKFDSLFKNSDRFGLDRPPVNLSQVPAFIRYMPDRLMHNRLVECMGVGKDQTLKLKLDKFVCLGHWDAVCPTWLFVWDSHRKRWMWMPVHDLLPVVALMETKEFPEGKLYYPIDVNDLIVEWHDDAS